MRLSHCFHDLFLCCLLMLTSYLQSYLIKQQAQSWLTTSVLVHKDSFSTDQPLENYRRAKSIVICISYIFKPQITLWRLLIGTAGKVKDN